MFGLTGSASWPCSQSSRTVLANGHPLILRDLSGRMNSPLLTHLTALDLILLLGALIAAAYLLLPMQTPGLGERASCSARQPRSRSRSSMAGIVPRHIPRRRGDRGLRRRGPRVHAAPDACRAPRRTRHGRCHPLRDHALPPLARAACELRLPRARGRGQARCNLRPHPFSPLRATPRANLKPPGSPSARGRAAVPSSAPTHRSGCL
jgi:hypothetical protein